MRKIMKYLCLLSLALGLSLTGLTGSAMAKQKARGAKVASPLKPPQKELWEIRTARGLKAARQGKWKQAIKWFTEAYDEAGPNPSLVFNLALAHASHGDVIPATAWFRAYLVMVPDAVNAKIITQEIARLDKEVRKGAITLMRQAFHAAVALPDIPSGEKYSRPKKLSSLSFLISNMYGMELRELAQEAVIVANNVAKKLNYKNYPAKYSDEAQRSRYFSNLAKAGDIVGLRQNRSRMKDDKEFQKTTFEAAYNLSEVRPAAAFTAAIEVPNSYWNTYSSTLLTRAAAAGLIDEAISRSTILYTKNGAYSLGSIARIMLRQGRIQEARDLARDALKLNKKAGVNGTAGYFRKAMSQLRKHKPSVFQFYGSQAQAQRLAGVLLLVGSAKQVRQVARVARKLKIKNKETDRQMIKIAEAYADLARGRTKQAIKKLLSVDRKAYAIDWNVPNVIRNIVTYSVLKKKLKTGEAFILSSFVPFGQRPDLLREIAEAYENRNNIAEMERLRALAETIELRARGGWHPNDPQQAKAVKIWCRQARKFSDGVNTKQIDIITRKILTDSKTEDIPTTLSYTGGIWANSLMRLEALEKLDPESVTWN